MTVLEVLQSSTEYFKKRKIESPRLNAEHLLAHALGQTRMELYLEFERKLGEDELVPLREVVRRRGEGEPLQHLLGTVEFCGLTFLCDKRAMVPRPETEELVESLKSEIRNPKSEILDVGTGSGVIALSLAAQFSEADIVAIDISDDALTLAQENATKLGLINRPRFLKSDLLENMSERFDVIVANLPYVPMNDRQSLSRDVLNDPEVAIFGGERGDELICQLIEQAPPRLESNGLLALEHGVSQEGGLIELLTRKNFHDIESKRDYSGTPRFIFSRYG
jgi:release factor glutamine methyltransferase